MNAQQMPLFAPAPAPSTPAPTTPVAVEAPSTPPWEAPVPVAPTDQARYVSSDNPGVWCQIDEPLGALRPGREIATFNEPTPNPAHENLPAGIWIALVNDRKGMVCVDGYAERPDWTRRQLVFKKRCASLTEAYTAANEWLPIARAHVASAEDPPRLCPCGCILAVEDKGCPMCERGAYCCSCWMREQGARRAEREAGKFAMAGAQ